MLRSPAPTSLLPLAVALLLTLAFAGCRSETRSLNTTPGGNGGEEGETPGDGTGGRAGAGRGSVSDAGRHAGATGGGGPVAGTPFGGSSNAGSSGGPTAGAPQGGSAGNGGVPNGGVGATAGFAGSAGGPGPAGNAGGAGYPGCNSSDGFGCNGTGFCVDAPLDDCLPDTTSDCSGLCATRYLNPSCSGFQTVACPPDFECMTEPRSLHGTDPYGICIGGAAPECAGTGDCAQGFECVPTSDGDRCVPDRARCRYGTCSSVPPPECPVGYAAADAQACDYVCVPYEQCGCEQDSDCEPPSSCDREEGRCFAPRAPAPRCAEAFDMGTCPGAIRVYAFADGDCKAATYSGCEGNGNRFDTLGECLSACRGMPLEQACPEGSISAFGCLACGTVAGCMKSGNYCFETCETSDDCATGGYGCMDGICQAVFCI